MSAESKQLTKAHAVKRYEEVLNSYRADPKLLKEHYFGEEESRKGYTRRVLLEFLQNAEDAFDEADQSGPVSISLDGDIFSFKNGGKPISTKGFDSLCVSFVSPKRGFRFIGSKGTGFKSILNWSEEITLVTPLVSVRFSRRAAREIIRKELPKDRLDELEDTIWNPTKIAVLRIPMEICERGATDNSPGDPWVTDITCRVRPGKVQEIKRSIEIALQPSCLLFTQRIESVEMRISQSQLPKTISISRESVSHDNLNVFDIAVGLEDGECDPETYRVFRKDLANLQPKNEDEHGRSEIAFAVPTTAHNLLDAKVFNFFPITKPSPLRRVPVHATFLLKSDREDIRDDDADYHDCLIEELADLAREVMIPWASETLAERCLDIFAPSENIPSEDERTLYKLHNQLFDAIKYTPFVLLADGKTRAAPDDCVISHDLSCLLLQTEHDSVLHIVHPDWCDTESRQKILRQFGAHDLELEKVIEILQGVPISSREFSLTCIEALGELLKDIPGHSRHRHTEQIRKLELWPLGSSEFVSAASGPIYRAAEVRKSGYSFPKWAPVRILDSKFEEDLEKLADQKPEVKRLLGDIDCVKDAFDLNAYLSDVLTASLGEDATWWSENGRECYRFLCDVHLSSESDTPLFDPLRQKLAESIYVPTKSDGWAIAWKCYAGIAWENPVGERICNNLDCDDRHVVVGPQHFPGEREEVARFLKFLGVSWGAKLVRFEAEHDDEITNPFGIKSIAPLWDEYWRFLGRREPNNVAMCVTKTWAFEGLAEYLESDDRDSDETINRLCRLYRDNLENHDTYSSVSYMKPRGYIWHRLPSESFPLWQLRHLHCLDGEEGGSPLIPDQKFGVDSALLIYSQSEVQRWRRWLPHATISRTADADDDRRAILRKLGAKFSIEEFCLADWLNWLKEMEKSLSDHRASKLDLKNVRSFMKNLGDTNFVDVESLPGSFPIESKEGVGFQSKSTLYVCDDTRWNEVADQLLNRSIPILVSRFKTGKNIAKLLGFDDRYLTDHLKILGVHGTNPDEERFEFCDRIRNCSYLMYSLVEHSSGLQASEKFRDRRYLDSISPRRKLSLEMEIDGQEIGAFPVSHYFDDQSSKFYVDDKNFCDSLASAIVTTTGEKETSIDAYARLLEKLENSPQVAEEFLRERGVTGEVLDHWRSFGERDSSIGLFKGSIDESDNGVGEKFGGPNEKGPEKPNGIDEQKIQVQEIPPTGSSEGTKTEPGNSGGGFIGQAAKEAGRKAEDLIRISLQSVLLPPEWQVSDAPVQDEENRETDIRVIGPSGTFHIEVKSCMASPQFFWSELEVELAKIHKEKYYLVMVMPEKVIKVVQNPIEIFRDCVVGGQWKLQAQNSVAKSQLPKPAWSIPESKPEFAGTDPSFLFTVKPSVTTLQSALTTVDDFVAHLLSIDESIS